ncbi:MAG: hypothetical protein H7211_09525 [Aquabacterium sp.]|nr:hypothetical protein [Ferruginibacter sp.]
MLIVVQTKKQQWASSLCHSRVPHTYGELLLRYQIAFFVAPFASPLIRDSSGGVFTAHATNY